VAYVVLREGGSLARLERFCRAELPAFAHPSAYEPRASLARLPSGKYDMEAVRAAAEPPSAAARAETPSRGMDPGHRRPRAGLHLAGGT
jgi:acyl-CoA synthetase (AMP-forming)/AMP-acid ligase II